MTMKEIKEEEEEEVVGRTKINMGNDRIRTVEIMTMMGMVMREGEERKRNRRTSVFMTRRKPLMKNCI